MVDVVSEAQAHQIIAHIEAKLGTRTLPADAVAAAKLILGLYPSREVNDAETYAKGMTALFAAYHPDFVRRVCDPVTGLPSKLKWLPTMADVKAALEEEYWKRQKILANAKWVISQWELMFRRRREAQEDASIDYQKRRERVAAIMAPFRSGEAA